eukprot:3933158-Rhodomonas_salina.1
MEREESALQNCRALRQYTEPEHDNAGTARGHFEIGSELLEDGQQLLGCEEVEDCGSFSNTLDSRRNSRMKSPCSGNVCPSEELDDLKYPCTTQCWICRAHDIPSPKREHSSFAFDRDPRLSGSVG